MVKKIFIALSALMIIGGCSEKKVEPINITEVKKDEKLSDKYIHVPSPEWRDQIIYFVMIDRFNDGDKTNNDQGFGEYDPTTNNKYNGGDLKGIIDKVDYIKDLGVTSVWITPPVANQWLDPTVNYAGYHGYWAENFMELDKHLGNIDTYKELSKTLHKNNMYLIQDIVCNHVGNFFEYKGGYDPSDPTKFYEVNFDSKPVNKPTQYPFSMNNPLIKENREAAIYHWTPSIKDYQNSQQLLTYQMSGLDDLNTESINVRNALKDSYSYWIKEVGVDAFRIDTVIYAEHDFWNDFIHSKDKEHLGINEYAKKFGKNDFFTFGETWVNVAPLEDEGDRVVSSYVGKADRPELSSVLNFPLHVELLRVFGEGKPTEYLGYRIQNSFKYNRFPQRLVNFVDNHDMARMVSYAPTIALKQALMFIMTIPGIPAIYYGTEQYFTETRAAMFGGGYKSEGKDNFNKESDSYKFIQSLTSLRKQYDVLRDGKLRVIGENSAGTGIFSYRLENLDSVAIVIFNTSDEPYMMDNLPTGLEEGTKLKAVYGLFKNQKDFVVGERGLISSILQPREGVVYIVNGKQEIGEVNDKAKISIDNGRDNEQYDRNVEIKGKYSNTKEVSLVLDGSVKEAIKCELFSDGTWRVILPVENLVNGKHSFVAYAKALEGKNKNDFVVSKKYEFEVSVPFVKSNLVVDSVRDDKGPKGTYKYPTDPSFKNQMDIELVTLFKSGNNLKISVKMVGDITSVWNPKFGFDHTVFNIFLSVPKMEGSAIEEMPLLNSKLPRNMKWNYMAFIGGWNNGIYESSGASKESFGKPVTPMPRVSVNKKENTIDITINGKAIGSPEKLEGIKVYITTWDYDGMENKYRALEKDPMQFSFGGGNADDPKIMDETEIILVK